MTQKPLPIAWFERLFLLSFALSTIELVRTSIKVTSGANDDSAATTALIGVIIGAGLVCLITFLFWFFIMRRRSNFARWLLAILTVAATPMTLFDPDRKVFDIWRMIEFASLALGIGCVVLLFLPGARRWFDGSRDDLAETFS